MMVGIPTELPSFGAIEAHGWTFIIFVRYSLKGMVILDQQGLRGHIDDGRSILTMSPD